MLTYADVWQVIREATADKQAEPTDRLSLRAHMPSVVDQESMGMGVAQHSWDSLSVTCKLFVSDILIESEHGLNRALTEP